MTSGTGSSVVVMDAREEDPASVRNFVAMARHLRGIGLAAPEILFAGIDCGILVIEDFGDAVFARTIRDDPMQEAGLYQLACDVLLALHAHAPPKVLPAFKPPFDAPFLAPAYAWYLRDADGSMDPRATACCAALNAALARHADAQSVMILRDYHSENLIQRPDERGLARVGILDFQDAMAGHPAYDLASLLTDARRDVSDPVREATISRYLANSDQDETRFRAALAVLGAQRNLRILGVFARLCLAMGKPHYVDLIPRVWTHLLRDLAHDALDDLRRIILSDLPQPTPDHLNHLRSRCASLPIP